MDAEEIGSRRLHAGMLFAIPVDTQDVVAIEAPLIVGAEGRKDVPNTAGAFQLGNHLALAPA